MRITIAVDSLSLPVELDSWRSTTTLAELVAAVGGPRLEDDESIYVDTRQVRAGDPLDRVTLMEGSKICRFPLEVTRAYSS